MEQSGNKDRWYFDVCKRRSKSPAAACSGFTGNGGYFLNAAWGNEVDDNAVTICNLFEFPCLC